MLAGAHLPENKQPLLRIRTQPNDANAAGDIFGGWLMSQMDIAGAILAAEFAHGPVVTVAVKELIFIKPLFVYDIVSFYGNIEKIGNTSITVKLEAYIQRLYENKVVTIKVSDAILVYVAVSEPGKKRAVRA